MRDRLLYALRPGWARSVMLRRSAAALLVIAAAATAVTEREPTRGSTVYVAAHDLRPGQTLTASDLRQHTAPDYLVPAGALRLSADADAHTVTGPVRAGEIITEARLLSPRLPAQLLGQPDARLVPVRLADESTTSLLRVGDVVDVLAPDARVLARAAVVAVVPPSPVNPRSTATPPVLLAMPEIAAHRVAGAALDLGLAVVVH